MDEAKIQLFDQIKNLLSLNMRGMLIPSTLYDAVHRNWNMKSRDSIVPIQAIARLKTTSSQTR